MAPPKFFNAFPLMSGLLPFSITPVLAAHGHVSEEALPLFQSQPFFSFLTNSCFVALIVLGVILWITKNATTNMRLVPHGAQNAFEFLVEFLYNWVEMIVGPKLAPKCFPLLATLFIFILTANWFGLLPGVGTFGYGEGTGFPLMVKEVDTPIFRPAADINMNAGMAICFMLVWLVITIREVE